MRFTAACIQLCSSTDVAQNIETVDHLVRDAVERGADYVQTPEMTNIVQRDRAALAASIAAEQSDPAVARFAALAAELGIVLHIGSLALKAADGRIANRALIFGRGGHVLARYDKIHLFDVDLPGGESYRESKNYQGGDCAVLAALPWGTLGVTICYDLRFPHLYRTLAKAGADFLAIPSAFTRPTGAAHWHVLMRARAIENGCFVFAAAQAGKHETGRETYGHSLIVSPWGEILAEGDGIHPSVIVADVKSSDVRVARQRIPSLQHDRPFQITRASAVRTKEAS